MKISLEALTWLETQAGARALELASQHDDPLRALSALRADHGAERSALALEVSAARKRAAPKFGPYAERLFADRAGVEQSTSLAVARLKAARLRDVGLPVADLGCGLGADALAAREAGLPVVAIDLDPARAWMARRNANVPVAIADAAKVCTKGYAAHLDPARRQEGVRRWQPDDFAPPPQVWLERHKESPALVIKLGPGLDTEALPLDGEAEFVSEAGRLVALHLWTGPLASASRRATLVRGGSTWSFAGSPRAERTEAAPFEHEWIHTADPALERAGLLQAYADSVDLQLTHPELGLLCGARRVDSPWLTAHQLLEQLPFQERRIRERLREFEGAPLIVKVRGKAVDNPERFAERLVREHGPGSGDPTVLFVLRDGRRRFALLTRRVRGGEA